MGSQRGLPREEGGWVQRSAFAYRTPLLSANVKLDDLARAASPLPGETIAACDVATARMHMREPPWVC